MEELLSLKWNNHRSTFLHILTILRDKQLYTDATLACEGRFYSVHRLVLSTCSDYFSAMFDRTTCKNPIIVLKDIKCEDLEALLDYMYLGEVNVRQADLASLIKAAECLRVKGLAVPDDEPPQKRVRGDNSNFRRSDGAGSPPLKRKKREEGQDGREDIRPSGSGGGSSASSRPKSPQSQSRLSPVPQDGSDANTASPSHLQQSSSDLSQGNNVPQSSVDGQTPFVKVEMEDSGGDDMGGGDSFNMNNDSFKEENNEDQVGDLSNDLPEFLQQSTDSSYSHSFAGPSFQPDLPNWQGDQVLSSNNFSGLGFPSQSQDGSQNTSGRGMCRPRSDLVEIVCYVCGKEITGRNRRQKLQYHLMTHTNQRPHPCPACPYRAHHKFTLYRHLRSVHKELLHDNTSLLSPDNRRENDTDSNDTIRAEQQPQSQQQPQLPQ